MAEKQCNLLKNGGEIVNLETDSVTGKGITVSFKKMGYVKSLQVSGSTSSALASNDAIITVPEKYRPVNEIANSIDFADTLGLKRLLYNATDHTLRAGGSIASGTALRGVFT